MSGLMHHPRQASHATAQAPTADRSEGVSHLDSFFDGSGWTREDVMVVAAGIQILLWLTLLYVEVAVRA